MLCIVIIVFRPGTYIRKIVIIIQYNVHSGRCEIKLIVVDYNILRYYARIRSYTILYIYIYTFNIIL